MRASSLPGVLAVILTAAVSCAPVGTRDVRRYIASAWDSTVRYQLADTPDSLLGMPRPYTVPCVAGMFNELYYWDTYFTNAGLLADGRTELALGNTEDLLSLVGRFGFVPNGNRTWYLSRSQPPLLSHMVGDVFSVTRDTSWLAAAYPLLEKEYQFWMTERLAPCGLNHYGWIHPSPELIDEFITTAGRRLGTDFRALGWSEEELDKFGRDCIAECESGWDFNPRFDRRCGDYCPVDLNAHLYGMECRMADFARILGLDPAPWTGRAEDRRARMRQFLFDSADGLWYDYDYTDGQRSGVVSAAVFALLFNGVTDEAEAAALKNVLPRLEYPGGLSVCEDKDYPYAYQWSWPNAWPPTTFMAVKGLLDYGFTADARRLAEKYLTTCTRAFRTTGQLWEKTDCRTGGLPVDREYGTPAMMGWTAGTFVCLDEWINNKIL